MGKENSSLSPRFNFLPTLFIVGNIGAVSSKRLNRVARRIAAMALALDNYPLVLWTISKWNFSDHGSRVYEPWRKQ